MSRSTGFPLQTRVTIIERAGGVCEKCGQARPQMHAHHRRCRGMGSTRRAETNEPQNGLWLCAQCHYEVENNRTDSYRMGWLVKQTADPATVPVFRLHEWVLLSDDGSVLPVGSPQQEGA